MDLAVEESAPLAMGSFFDALLQARRDGHLLGQQAFSSGGCKLLELKASHRRLCESTDELRLAASSECRALDQSSLQLQNLYFERQHYEKEIATCRGWASAFSDEQIALVSEEEFAALEGKLAEEADPHQRMLNRLNHEVAFRGEHVKRLDAVKAQRDALAADVAQKRSTVAGLEAEIGKLLAAAQAVQQQYGIGGSGPAAGESLQQQADGDAPPPPPAPPVDVPMQEAGA
ncbi:hypothetical protein D9Q98_003757 [Chlorella vulgaris]|uniref:Uncharacterized protein n=1 Tax=Chlorella vulgaris TaxID=3077 RepID=A0A9D4YZQ0_CHLVU|nr:hypothetical protein D9Q98_003757 [Chlorella vulgaris]